MGQTLKTVALAFIQTALIPFNFSLPLIIKNSLKKETSITGINLIIVSFLIDVLGNLPLGTSLVGFSASFLLFLIVKDNFELTTIQTYVLLILTPFVWELIARVYLTLLL